MMTTERESSQSPGMASLSDEELIGRYKSEHDREAFSTLVHRYERELFNYLRRYLGDAELADDAFQAAFLQVHLKCDQFEEGRKFRPWLYTVATNQAIDAQRRAKRHRAASLDQRGRQDGENQAGALIDLLSSRETAPDEKMDVAQQRAWMQEELAKLPESLQSVVHLIYYQGLKYREAAEALEIPVGTVKSRLHAAILKLNEAWIEHEPTTLD